jgi:hypothetical protein
MKSAWFMSGRASANVGVETRESRKAALASTPNPSNGAGAPRKS